MNISITNCLQMKFASLCLVETCTCMSLENKSFVGKRAHKQLNEPKRQESSCAPNEDAHSRSLIRFFTGRILDSQWFKVSSCGQRRLIRLRRCAGWFDSSLSAHARRYVSSHSGSNNIYIIVWLIMVIYINAMCPLRSIVQNNGNVRMTLLRLNLFLC